MERDEITAANRLAWNQAAPHHEKHTFSGLLSRFAEPGFNALGDFKTTLFRDIGFPGKSMAHIACNNGRELISLRRLGAGRCLGLDISEPFVEQARRLAAAAQVDCEFRQGDIYSLAKGIEPFDIVFITPGTLRWMPDLPGFLAASAALLRPGGVFFVLEMHPILDGIRAEGAAPGRVEFQESYFARGPFVHADGLDYYGGTRYESAPAYWFHHGLAEVLTGCRAAGLALEALSEYPIDLSGGRFKALESRKGSLPLSYALAARRAQLP